MLKIQYTPVLPILFTSVSFTDEHTGAPLTPRVLNGVLHTMLTGALLTVRALTGVRGLLHNADELVELRVERDGERTIDDVAVDLRAKVDLHDVVVREDRL